MANMQLISSSSASLRAHVAREWLAVLERDQPALIIANNRDTGRDVLRASLGALGAVLDWHVMSLRRLAHELARPCLLKTNKTPISGLSAQALMSRVLHENRERLGKFSESRNYLGFSRAALSVLEEIRLADLDASRFAAAMPDLGLIAVAYEKLLDAANLVDYPRILDLAIGALKDEAEGHPLIGCPILAVDIKLDHAREANLLVELSRRSSNALMTFIRGDQRSLEFVRAASGEAIDERESTDDGTISNLQRHLFGKSGPESLPTDKSFVVFSAPGEHRESIEVAREILSLARAGVPFDRIAVLARSIETYRPHLEAAFARAEIPAHFAKGTTSPDPAGRAFLSLLRCAEENLSAIRFAEYLSLAEVPELTKEGAPRQFSPLAGC